jgi:hypothetical protein
MGIKLGSLTWATSSAANQSAKKINQVVHHCALSAGFFARLYS